MPKKIRIPAKRADRSVRWTLEVSADAGKAAKDASGATGKRTSTAQRTTPRKSSSRQPVSREAKPTVKKVKKRTLPAKTSQPAAVTPSPDPRASARMSPAVLAMAAGAVVVVVAMILTREPSLRASAARNGGSEVAVASEAEPAVTVAPAPRVAAPVAVAAI